MGQSGNQALRKRKSGGRAIGRRASRQCATSAGEDARCAWQGSLCWWCLRAWEGRGAEGFANRGEVDAGVRVHGMACCPR